MPHSTVEAGEPAQRDPVEGRGHRVTELLEGNMAGTSRPTTVSTRLQQIATLANQIRSKPLTSLSYHMDLDWFREAYRRTRKDGATGGSGPGAPDTCRHPL